MIPVTGVVLMVVGLAAMAFGCGMLAAAVLDGVGDS